MAAALHWDQKFGSSWKTIEKMSIKEK